MQIDIAVESIEKRKIKQVLGISENKRLRLVISIGYADETDKRYNKRKDIDKILKVF